MSNRGVRRDILIVRWLRLWPVSVSRPLCLFINNQEQVVLVQPPAPPTPHGLSLLLINWGYLLSGLSALILIITQNTTVAVKYKNSYINRHSIWLMTRIVTGD